MSQRCVDVLSTRDVDFERLPTSRYVMMILTDDTINHEQNVMIILTSIFLYSFLLPSKMVLSLIRLPFRNVLLDSAPQCLQFFQLYSVCIVRHVSCQMIKIVHEKIINEFLCNFLFTTAVSIRNISMKNRNISQLFGRRFRPKASVPSVVEVASFAVRRYR